jgi:hypothetical protein
MLSTTTKKYLLNTSAQLVVLFSILKWRDCMVNVKCQLRVLVTSHDKESRLYENKWNNNKCQTFYCLLSLSRWKHKMLHKKGSVFAWYYGYIRVLNHVNRMITQGLQCALSLHIFLSFVLESNPADVNYHQWVFVTADQTHYAVLSFFSIKLIDFIYSVCLGKKNWHFI